VSICVHRWFCGERWAGFACGLLLAAGTLAVYWPVTGFDFVTLDDPLYVSQTRIVQRGLSWPGVVWAFQCVQGGNWNPLVWLSHMADCQLYGVSPGGHHLTNLLLHVANALLLFQVLRRMTGAIWRSGFAAALFAWHPLHVESVAWVSERKDVLSALFWLLTIWAYVRYVEGRMQNAEASDAKHAPRNTHHATLCYLLSLFFFALGLMSKPMLVTLPFVLLLLDFWPLQRLSFPTLHPAFAPSLHPPSTPLFHLIREKLPFAVLSLAASGLAIWAQQNV